MQTNNLFNELKKISNVQTTEDLFGLSEYVPVTCEFINKAKNIVEDINRETYLKSGQQTEENYKEAVEFTQSWINDIGDELEKLRAMNNNLRQWGQSWKDLAKRIIAKNGNIFIEISNFCYDDDELEFLKKLF